MKGPSSKSAWVLRPAASAVGMFVVCWMLALAYELQRSRGERRELKQKSSKAAEQAGVHNG